MLFCICIHIEDATGKNRVAYKSLFRGDCNYKISGLPVKHFRKPRSYGDKDLRQILLAGDEIRFIPSKYIHKTRWYNL